MEIILKNIYTSERVSPETTVYQAMLYINGYKVGGIANDGQGAAIMYRPIDDRGIALIREAEVWCRKLPLVVFPDTLSNGKPVTIPMELEIYLGDMVTEWMNKKDIEAFRWKTEKRMKDAILYGVPNKTFRVTFCRFNIDWLIKSKRAVEQLRLDIRYDVLPLLAENEKILNTNIPRKIIRRLDVPAGKWVDERGL
jgi:hypothetical protein